MSSPLFLLLALTGICLSAQFNVPFRQFSLSPSLTRTGSTDPYDPTYGAAQFFVDYAKAYTSALAPAGAHTIEFVPQGVEWGATGACTTIKKTGRVDGCAPPVSAVAQYANMDAGGQLNPVWGFVYESAPAFGVRFPQMYDFLFTPTGIAPNVKSGLQFLQEILDSRNANVVVIPVSASPRQASGYLKKDAGVVGLAEICKSNYTWRFLPPSQQILDRACDIAAGPAKRINFVASIVGQTVPTAVQSGLVTAFEYASAMDNFDALTGGFFPLNGYTGLCSPSNPQPQCLHNPGHRGLRYVHYPGWHQEFFISYLQINKDLWSNFSAAQKQALYDAGQNALKDSWKATSSTECAITEKILAVNDGQIQLNLDGTPFDCDNKKPGVQTCSADMQLASWKPIDLEVLKGASVDYLDSLAGPSDNQVDFAKVRGKYEAYTTGIGFEWKREQFPRGCNGRDASPDTLYRR